MKSMTLKKSYIVLFYFILHSLVLFYSGKRKNYSALKRHIKAEKYPLSQIYSQKPEYSGKVACLL